MLRAVSRSFSGARAIVGKTILASMLIGAAASQGQTKVMPLGDSITTGIGSTGDNIGYRKQLWSLMDASYSVDFVGTQTGGDGQFDENHEGHNGFRADEIRAGLSSYLAANNPDVVFLNVGTNDISQGDDANTVLTDISNIIDDLVANNSAVEIYVSTIIPRKDDAALQTVTDDVNGQLPSLVQNKQSQGKKVYLVDNANRILADPNWQTNLYADNLHPNDTGYSQIGQEFYNGYAANNPGGNPVSFSDDFNAGLKAEWVVNPVYKVINQQLVNVDSLNTVFDGFDNFIAVPNIDVNPNAVQFTYGTESNQIGRYFSGFGLLLDAPTTTANGYLLFHTENEVVKLFEIVNGKVNGAQITSADGTSVGAPQIGDVFRVEMSTTAAGHIFRVFRNGTLYATLTDPNKRQGNAATTYSGIMINNNTQNGVDDFLIERVIDTTPPAAISDLTVKSTGSTSIGLQWTAPGDDGSTGQASSYDIRYSTAPITGANFASATVATGAPAPSVAGTTESFTVTGLVAGNSYYFAIKTTDDAGNVSAVSNSPMGSTSSLVITTDDFERAGPGLGANWNADPEIEIVNGAAQATSIADVFDKGAVFTKIRNPVEITMKWGPNAAQLGTSFSGIYIADGTDQNGGGYLIQRRKDGTNPATTYLKRVAGGIPGTVVASGSSLGPDPGPGSVMKVVVTRDVSSITFDVYIDDVFDRTLTDTNPSIASDQDYYAGFILNDNVGDQNAVDVFTVGAQPSGPAVIAIVSGNNQSAPVNEPFANPVVFRLEDGNGIGVEGEQLNFTISPAGAATLDNNGVVDGNARKEAESGTISGPGVMEVREDANASGGKYVLYPAPDDDASVKITFFVQEAGTYYFWTRSITQGNPTNNYGWDVQINGGTRFRYNVFGGQSTVTNWTWDQIKDGTTRVTASLNAGSNTITFHAAHYNTWLDKILVTSDPNYTPSGLEPDQGYITDANGEVQVNVTAGASPATASLVASHPQTPNTTATLTITAGSATKIVKISGDNQSGAVGAQLAQPLVVEVQDDAGNGVAGVNVRFVALKGAGSFDLDQPVVTDANGRASVNYTVGPQSTTQIIEAFSDGLTGSPVTFTATATGGLANKLQLVSGGSQTGEVLSDLANPVVVKVVDAANKAIPDYPVSFEVVSGGGSVNKPELIKNPTLEGTYYENGKGRGLVAPSWNAWSSDDSRTHSEVTGYSSTSAQRVNTTGTATGASILQAIKEPVPNNARLMLSFFYKTDTNSEKPIRVKIRKTVQDVMEDIEVPPTGNQWRHFVYFFNWDTTFEPAEIHFIVFDNVIADFDDIHLNYVTDAQGQIAATWTLGSEIGQQQIQARALIEATELTGSPLAVNATATAGVASNLVAVTETTLYGSAGQELPSPLKVKVTDVASNPKAGHTVTFEIKSGGGKLNGTQTLVDAQTDVDGIASVLLTLGPNVGAKNSVEARASQGGSPLTGSPVTFDVFAAVASKISKLSGDNQTGSATQPLPKKLEVLVEDDQARPVAGHPVTFLVGQGGGSINGKQSIVVNTGVNGVAAVTLTLGPIPGTQNTVDVTATGPNGALTGSPLRFTATAVNLTELKLLSGNNQSGIVGTPLGQPFKVKVVDALGNGVKGWPVLFLVTGGGGHLGNGITQKTVDTDSLGIAKVNLTLGPQAGNRNNTVDARAEFNGQPLTNSPVSFFATGLAGAPDHIAIAGGDGAKGVVGNPLAEPLKVLVADKEGNGIPNYAVTFEVKAGGGNLSGFTKRTVLSNAQGIAQVILTLGPVAGTNNNIVEASAISGTAPLNNSPLTFKISATANDARNMGLVSGNNQTGKAGFPLAEKLKVRITDSNGNNVPGHPVTFTVKKGGGTLDTEQQTVKVVNTDAQGVASISWVLGGLTGENAQTVEASATDGVGALNGSPVIFRATAAAGATDPQKSSVVATGPVVADGIARSEVTVTLRDAFGNPVAGNAVVIIVTGEGNIINQPTVPTDQNGQVKASFTSTRSGLKTVTARDVNSQVDITNGTTVEFKALPAARLVLESGNGQVSNVGTALKQPLVAKVTDVNGNPIANHPVTFAEDQGNGYVIERQPLKTDENGLAKATYVLGKNAGLNLITASAQASNGQALSGSPVTFSATGKNSTAARAELAFGNAQSGVAGEALPERPAVLITDAEGNPIFGHRVTFRVTFGNGTVNGESEVTVKSDAFGLARVSWVLGPQAGVNFMQAEAEGIVGIITFQAQGTSGSASKLVAVGNVERSGVVNQKLGSTLGVKVTDNNGNPVSGVIIKFKVSRGTGTLSAEERVTNADGYAAVEFTFGTDAGDRVVRAWSNGLTGSPLNFYLTGRAAGANTITLYDGDKQTGTKNKALSRPLRVKVVDRYGNPVENAAVTFVISGGSGGGFAEAQPVRTNSRGLAQTTWILGPLAGSNQATAILAGSKQVSFTATGIDNNVPVFTEINNISVNETQVVEFEVKATDPDNDPIGYSAVSLPNGASFAATTSRIFRWATGYDDAGYHDVVFAATDSRGGRSELLVTIKVEDTNQPPVITNWQPASSTVDVRGPQTVRFEVLASDDDGDQVDYLWFIDGKHVGSENVFDFRQTKGGRFTFEVRAFDSQDTTKKFWNVITDAVRLVNFSAAAHPSEGVTLNWVTADENGNAGFNILRSVRKADGYEMINPEMIRTGGGGDYTYLDKDVEAGRRYYYKLEDVSITGEREQHGPISVVVNFPESYELSQNYPNPFNPTTTIRYQLPKQGVVTLKIYDTLGREVRTLVDGRQRPGIHTVLWDGKNSAGLQVPSGVYYYRIIAGEFSQSRKMLLLK
ncbi:MAG TPA: T9SS type A sorting domain-containing protein [Bacteroidetes bacterium]|nr:T9SS type A sorting domain-containing protein [Bacteroidota bacterium]